MSISDSFEPNWPFEPLNEPIAVDPPTWILKKASYFEATPHAGFPIFAQAPDDDKFIVTEHYYTKNPMSNDTSDYLVRESLAPFFDSVRAISAEDR